MLHSKLKDFSTRGLRDVVSNRFRNIYITHTKYTFNFNVQNCCVSPVRLPVCQVPQHHRHQTLASLVRVWHRPHRVAGVRTGVHTMSGYDPWSMAGCPGVQPAGGLGGAGGGAAGGGLHLPGLGRLRAGSLGQPHPRPGYRITRLDNIIINLIMQECTAA